MVAGTKSDNEQSIVKSFSFFPKISLAVLDEIFWMFLQGGWGGGVGG